MTMYKNECVDCGDTWEFSSLHATLDAIDKENIKNHGQLYCECEDCSCEGYECISVAVPARSDKPKIKEETKMTNKLQGLTALQNSVTIYVPTTHGTSDKASEPRIAYALDMVQCQLATLFGGFTTTIGTGGYIAEDGRLVVETVHMVRANVADITDAQINNAVKTAQELKEMMRQECVSLEVNGTLYFV